MIPAIDFDQRRFVNVSTIVLALSLSDYNKLTDNINKLLFAEFVMQFYHYYGSVIKVIPMACPSPICTHLNVTTRFEMHFFASGGTHQGALKEGLKPDDYIAKANEFIAPDLRKNYSGIRDKVDQGEPCQLLRKHPNVYRYGRDFALVSASAFKRVEELARESVGTQPSD